MDTPSHLSDDAADGQSYDAVDAKNARDAAVERCGHGVPIYGHDCDACDAGNAESDLLR